MSLNFNELEQFLNDNVYKDPVSLQWTCNICRKTFGYRRDVARHIEVNHVSLPEIKRLIEVESNLPNVG